MKIFLKLLEVFGFAVIILIVYNLLRVYVLSKIKMNKWSRWIILVMALLVFFIPAYLGYNLTGTKLQYLQSGVFVVLFLWFLDLMGLGGRRNMNVNKNNNQKIRPKPKPNRVKNKK